MFKKLCFYILFFLLLIIFSISCEGPEGPEGPAGLAGTKGDKGDTGDKGNEGNANISKYTLRIKFPVDYQLNTDLNLYKYAYTISNLTAEDLVLVYESSDNSNWFALPYTDYYSPNCDTCCFEQYFHFLTTSGNLTLMYRECNGELYTGSSYDFYYNIFVIKGNSITSKLAKPLCLNSYEALNKVFNQQNKNDNLVKN